jgi:hypothetical protein
MPMLGSAAGIDGGAIFQIVAVESLGLDPRAIGVAFSLGVLSVPFQLAAARLPLWRARLHLQLFFALLAVQCWVLAALVAGDVAGGGVATVALGVTVVAEISLSVLYAPSWQPLLRFALSSAQRQSVNSRARAVGGAIVAVTVLLFGTVGDTPRAVLLVVVGAVAAVLMATVRTVPVPERPMTITDSGLAVPSAKPGALPAGMTPIYLALALVGLTATWPLFLIYLREVLWPSANLGALGAVQLTGALVAAATWRTTDADPALRGLRASGVVVAATVAIAAISAPVTGPVEAIVCVAAFAAGAAATTTVLLALMERAHQTIDNDTSVRALTVLDVVASTSMQVGLLAGGFLVAASEDRTDWLLDPYLLYLMAGGLAVVAALGTMRRTAPADVAGRL